MGRFVLLTVALALGCATALKINTEIAPTAADVKKVHDQLAVIATKLDGMVSDEHGALAHAKVRPALVVFVKELKTVLKETDSMKDTTKAMQKLQAAKAGMAGLTTDLTHRQEDLMKEDSTQRESLLIGVLMTHQKQPIKQQLEILSNGDFATLDVSKELLAKHDDQKPLYVQVAAYLDKHQGKQAAASIISQANAANAKTQAVAESLQKRVDSLEHEYKVRESNYAKVIEMLHKKSTKAKKSEQHVIEVMKKRETRNWKKWAAIRKHDIKTMKDAVDAVKRGDMKAIQKAMNAMKASLQAMKSQNSGFLVLLEMGHTLMQKDCPYCAAQCVDKCHQEGKPYVQCMTDCADAGKGF